MKSAFGGKGEGLDKQKFTMLISEYRQYIAQNVNHISLNQAANSNAYSESSFKPYQISLIQSSWKHLIITRRGDTPFYPTVGWDLLWHGHFWRHRARQEDQDWGWVKVKENDFFAPNGQSRGWQRCFGAKYQFLFETVQKGPDGPKRVPNGQKHLGWPFWSLSDPFGPLWSVDKPAMFGPFWSKMDHF